MNFLAVRGYLFSVRFRVVVVTDGLMVGMRMAGFETDGLMVGLG